MSAHPAAAGRRRAPLAGLCLAAGLALAGCPGADVAPKAPPRIAFAETVHAYGRVAQGATVEHAFPFVNQGGVPLTIMELRTAEDTRATIDGGPDVVPGAGATVRVGFDTTAAPGRQRRTVTVYSNDPAQRAIVLSLEGEVGLDVAADPPQVYLGTVRPGMPALRQVALLSGAGARFAAPSTDAAQLRVELLETAAGPRLAIGTAPDAPPGAFVATVRVPTTSAVRPVLPIEVAGTIAADRP